MTDELRYDYTGAEYVPFKPAGTPKYDYQSPDFQYGNWPKRQPYWCRPCWHQNIHRPPVGIIEWIDEDREITGDFTPVCYDHMHEQEARWWALYGEMDA